MSAKRLGWLGVLLAACSGSDASELAAGSPARTEGAAQQSSSTPVRSGELTFAVPPGWIAETPAQLRKLQFRLPRADGDREDATLWVTDFGGGTREANADRWIAEFEQPDGRASREVAHQSTRRPGRLEVFEVDVAGTCVARMVPAGSATMREEGWRQIATILEGASKPYYVKVRGPAATVGKWEQAYRAFVDSATLAK